MTEWAVSVVNRIDSCIKFLRVPSAGPSRAALQFRGPLADPVPRRSNQHQPAHKPSVPYETASQSVVYEPSSASLDTVRFTHFHVQQSMSPPVSISSDGTVDSDDDLKRAIAMSMETAHRGSPKKAGGSAKDRIAERGVYASAGCFKNQGGLTMQTNAIRSPPPRARMHLRRKTRGRTCGKLSRCRSGTLQLHPL